MPDGSRLLLYCMAAVLLLGSGCREEGSPNLVLISIDSLRSDRLGCYGAEHDTSPAIDGLAAGGARFETALAPTSWTLPSHVTMFTGLSIAAHGVNAPKRRIDASRTLLAEHLARAGYDTAGFVSAPYLARAFGFARGFSVYTNFVSGKTAANRQWMREAETDETAPQVIGAALEWLEGRKSSEAPFFLFVHLWDVHYDYIPPEPYDTIFDPDYRGEVDARNFFHNEKINADLSARDHRHLRALYDGEIRWLDSQLEALLDALGENSDSGPTLIALVSDHGDEFFEHGNKGHRRTLFEESVRVPWILRHPGVIRPGTPIGGVASREDLAPTLLGLLGAPPLPEATGRDLSEQVKSGSAPEEVPVLLNLEKTAALRGLDWKVIRWGDGSPPSYYDLSEDPDEQSPMPASEFAPHRLKALKQRMIAELTRAKTMPRKGSKPVELSPEMRRKLTALGYAA